jgi:large conductance mechanosensitive channel
VLGFVKEFRDFINKGNLLDVAVGFVMGAAFTAVVNALVDNVIMPIAAIPFGQPNFDSALILTINGAEIKFGAFITALVTFLIVAFTIFLILKAYNSAARDVEEEEEEAPPAKDEVSLLGELVDEIKGMRTDLAGSSPQGSDQG